MARSRPGQSPLKPAFHEAGFTLIELLVAMVIIGIVASIAVMSIGGRVEEQLEREGKRVAALVDLASEEAVLRSRETGIQFTPGGYRFLVQTGDADQPWAVLEQDNVLRPRTLPSGLALTLYLEDIPVVLDPEPEQVEPQVVLFSSGERIPFELRVGTAGEELPFARLLAPLLGPLELDLVTEDERW